MMLSPCKDCPERHSHCHSSCERYLSWKKNWDEAHEALRIENTANYWANSRRVLREWWANNKEVKVKEKDYE